MKKIRELSEKDRGSIFDAAGIKKRKIPPQNLVIRLHHRAIDSRTKTFHRISQSFYQNITPNFTVTNVEKPPCFLRKFRPDGRYLIAFSADQTSLEIYKYMGPSAAAGLLHNVKGDSNVLKEDELHYNEIRKSIFDRFFKLKHTVYVATNGEQLNRECSLFTDDGKYVIVGSASTDHNNVYHFDMYRNNESVTPNPHSPLEDYTLHIVDIEMGRLCDSKVFKHDKIFLSHNQGLYLYQKTLAVLSVQHQTIHIFQVNSSGNFINSRTIGRVCYEDDDHILASVLPERIQPNYHYFRENTISSLKHRLLAFLFRQAKAKSEEEGNPKAVRDFLHHFEYLFHLRMWKMQLLDESHLLIKYASEHVVTLRAVEPNSQPSFFVVYNMITTEVLAVYENTSTELLSLFEQFADFFRNARLSCESQFTCSPSNNIWARLIQERFKATIVSARGGGCTEATKRLLAHLPISAQSYSASPYLDLSLFSYDDKWVSVMERPKNCADHPIRFLAVILD